MRLARSRPLASRALPRCFSSPPSRGLAPVASKTFSSAPSKSFSLPDLPYDYAALEPTVSGEIMTIHHTKHHQTYTTHLNAAYEKMLDAQAKGDIDAVIALQGAIKFNEFGSLDALKTKFNATAAAIQGSGWGWLGYDKAAGKIKIATCSNQDPLQHVHGLVPLLGIDVWEHAYYLQYKNVRPEYLKQIWSVVNWKDVEARYLAAK
ncbi:MAG: hypothetical protein SGPRY_001022 [Prymnesium sp.]